MALMKAVQTTGHCMKMTTFLDFLKPYKSMSLWLGSPTVLQKKMKLFGKIIYPKVIARMLNAVYVSGFNAHDV